MLGHLWKGLTIAIWVSHTANRRIEGKLLRWVPSLQFSRANELTFSALFCSDMFCYLALFSPALFSFAQVVCFVLLCAVQSCTGGTFCYSFALSCSLLLLSSYALLLFISVLPRYMLLRFVMTLRYEETGAFTP
jgi:hypothetical protein